MSHPSRTCMMRAAGAGATALCFGTGGALASDGLPEPIAEGPKKPSLSIEEQLAAAGDSAIAGRWLVEVSGNPAIKGGNACQLKRNQDAVLRAAASAGIALDVTRSYSTRLRRSPRRTSPGSSTARAPGSCSTSSATA